jgi:NACalpha-BTF3-like transcription factor
MKNETQVIPKIDQIYIREKNKKIIIQSPDISKMQMVEIDERTKIYIALDASVEDARRRFKEHHKDKKR